MLLFCFSTHTELKKERERDFERAQAEEQAKNKSDQVVKLMNEQNDLHNQLAGMETRCISFRVMIHSTQSALFCVGRFGV